MGRALSWSLAAHAAFIISFLLLSATRQPLTIPQVARPVRLVTYLEPAAASRPRAAAPVAPATARAVPVPAPAAGVPSVPAVAPRVVIPAGEKEPAASRNRTPQAEARPALSERLTRRLASAAPAENLPVEIDSPRIASLPPPVTATASSPDRAVTGTPSPQDAVLPVGYFPHAWYLAVLKERVFARWSPPSEFFQSRRPPVALVAFRIDRAGRITGINLKEGSGAARFDKSALAAVQGLGQVSALPEHYAEENLDVVIRFQNER